MNEEDESFSDSSFENFYAHFLKLTNTVGIRNSSKRESLLRALYTCKTYLSADQIHALLYTECRVRISITTVYKILAFFETIDVVSTVLTYPLKQKSTNSNALFIMTTFFVSNVERLLVFTTQCLKRYKMKFLPLITSREHIIP